LRRSVFAASRQIANKEYIILSAPHKKLKSNTALTLNLRAKAHL